MSSSYVKQVKEGENDELDSGYLVKGGGGNFCNSGWESEEKNKPETLFNGTFIKCDGAVNDTIVNNVEEVVNVNDDFFEGVEKSLEVWFTVNKRKESLEEFGSVDCDLRKIPRTALEDLLETAHCEIISSSKNSMVDAYVLSESSMFLSKRRFLLKTCGTTTPLDCMEKLLSLVKQYTGFEIVEDIFYSRKNYVKPELQRIAYRSNDSEVERLDKMFMDGAAYCMGTTNRDCWYIYTLNPMEQFQTKTYEQDQTLEIMMSDLDPEVMKIFYKENTKDGAEATKKSGICKLLPQMKIDDFLFEPCGYSMNGILENEDDDSGNGEYVTIHITPEKEFSYVSFETNVPNTSYRDLVKQVLDTFLPGKFVLTVYTTRTSEATSFHQDLKKSHKIGDWRRNDIQFCCFQDCDLTYCHFFKSPS